MDETTLLSEKTADRENTAPVAEDAADAFAELPEVIEAIESTPLSERAGAYSGLQEQLRLRLENADNAR